MGSGADVLDFERGATAGWNAPVTRDDLMWPDAYRRGFAAGFTARARKEAEWEAELQQDPLTEGWAERLIENQLSTETHP